MGISILRQSNFKNVKTMDHNYGGNGGDNVGTGTIYLLVSIISGIIGWIGKFDTGDLVKGLSMLLSGGAAILAGIYYWFAIKEKRIDVKRKQKENGRG